MTDKIKVIISNKQKTVKIPTGVRMLVRRCCNAVLAMEQFEGSAEISVSFVDDAEIRELNKNTVISMRQQMFCLFRSVKTAFTI